MLLFLIGTGIAADSASLAEAIAGITEGHLRSMDQTQKELDDLAQRSKEHDITRQTFAELRNQTFACRYEAKLGNRLKCLTSGGTERLSVRLHLDVSPMLAERLYIKGPQN